MDFKLFLIKYYLIILYNAFDLLFNKIGNKLEIKLYFLCKSRLNSSIKYKTKSKAKIW